ncbi:uncharacterized protein G2W53_031128 [Senna tora]|uniref:Uncharacterized protein n=1 Tax=Senna tora TaxID=362788 RepID=A0A834WHF3_9FABA|nr:uncharacterized protein G2W53_031128 [Senna tora]
MSSSLESPNDGIGETIGLGHQLTTRFLRSTFNVQRPLIPTPSAF